MKLDHQNAMLGGVCAGLGRHFGFDPLFFRLAFFLAFWFFGTGILLYVLLYILMQ